MRRHAPKAGANAKSQAFAGLFKKLKGLTGGSPRRKVNYKFWMCHPDFKPKFEAAFKLQIEKEPVEKTQILATRCRLAKKMFDAESDEVKLRIDNENTKLQEMKKSLYDKLLHGEDFDEEEVEDVLDDMQDL